MLICMFALAHSWTMQLERTDLVLTDTDLSRDQARMRALVAGRLERIWGACEPHLSLREDPISGEPVKPDVRFLEAGIRVLDRLSRLYRLDQPAQADPEAGRSTPGARELVKAGLAELEARMTADSRQDRGDPAAAG